MKVRLWKLGSLEHKIVPTPAAVKALERKVKKLTKGEEGVINIVWGPDLTVEEIEVNGKNLSLGEFLDSLKIEDN